MNGNNPHSGAPISLKRLLAAVEHVAQQHEQEARNDEQQRPQWVVPDLPEHPPRCRGRRACAHRAAASITAGKHARGRARRCAIA